MSDVVMVDGVTNTIADTIENVYTSPISGNGTKITAFSAINDTDTNASYKAYIYNSSGDQKCAVPFKVVVRYRYDVAPSITNQIIPPGGSLRVESNRADSICFRVSGVEL